MRFASPTALRILALSVLASGLCAQTTSLGLGKTVQGDLSGTEARDYTVVLEANQYMRADLTQTVATVVVELYAPDGKKLLDMNTGEFPRQSYRIACVAEAAGEYRIRVSAPAGTANASHYEVKLEELRAASAADRKS
jgi:hypothetical protein